jgi:hypothetical protein
VPACGHTILFGHTRVGQQRLGCMQGVWMTHACVAGCYLEALAATSYSSWDSGLASTWVAYCMLPACCPQCRVVWGGWVVSCEQCCNISCCSKCVHQQPKPAEGINAAQSSFHMPHTSPEMLAALSSSALVKFGQYSQPNWQYTVLTLAAHQNSGTAN